MRIEISSQPGNAAVSLFCLTPEDVSESYVTWLNSPVINRFLESRFQAHTLESTASFVDAMLASTSVLFLGIRCHRLQRHVGNIKLGPIDPHHRTGDVGILIGDTSAWGKGVASEAVRQLVEIAGTQLGLRKLTAGCYASNVGSQRAFEKAGFVVEGVRPAQFLLSGKPEGMILMGCILSQN